MIYVFQIGIFAWTSRPFIKVKVMPLFLREKVSSHNIGLGKAEFADSSVAERPGEKNKKKGPRTLKLPNRFTFLPDIPLAYEAFEEFGVYSVYYNQGESRESDDYELYVDRIQDRMPSPKRKTKKRQKKNKSMLMDKPQNI